MEKPKSKEWKRMDKARREWVRRCRKSLGLPPPSKEELDSSGRVCWEAAWKAAKVIKSE